MKMKWDGVTPEQYEAARDTVRWEEDIPEGAVFHVAWFADNAVHVVDVWESEDHWNRFVTGRLMPGVEEVGIRGEPQVKTFPAHAVFQPALAGRT